ncbi:MAG: tripartite tricarboxylate transporter TctB family protein [Candidatus Tectimicrobiota bacterium]
MTVQRYNVKDFGAGLIYVACGASAIVLAQDYGMGSAFKMGPGYFPSVLGGVLVGLGLIAIVRACLRAGSPIGPFALKGLCLVVGATLVFGVSVRGAGLLLALPVLVCLSALASAHYRWGATLALAAGLTLFCSLVFLHGLGVPLPLVGSWFGR